MRECLCTFLETVGLFSFVSFHERCKVATFRECLSTVCNWMAWLQREFSCHMQGCHLERLSFHTPCNCMAFLLCEFSCSRKGFHVERMPCNRMAFLLCAKVLPSDVESRLRFAFQQQLKFQSFRKGSLRLQVQC